MKLIILLVLIIIVYYNIINDDFDLLIDSIKNGKLIYISKLIPVKITNKFKKDSLIKNLSNTKVLYLEYFNRNNLDVSKYKKTYLEDFLTNKKFYNNNLKKFQIKKQINKNNDSINNYIIKILDDIKNKIISKLDNSIHFKFNTLRISHSNWYFPYHYDCSDNLIFQLQGSRIVYIKENNIEKKFILNEGDILIIPAFIEHKVIVNTVNLNINLTFTIINSKYINKYNKCNKKFNIDYPVQDKRCTNNQCI